MSRWDGLTALAARWWRPAAGALFWLIMPALCVVFLGFGIDQLVRHVNNVPAGTRGYFEVTSRSCHGQLCLTAGTFASTDGKLVVPNLLGDYRWHPGIRYGAVYDTNAAEVIPIPSWDPGPTVLGMVGAAGYLTLWGWSLRRRRLGAGLAKE